MILTPEQTANLSIDSEPCIINGITYRLSKDTTDLDLRDAIYVYHCINDTGCIWADLDAYIANGRINPYCTKIGEPKSKEANEHLTSVREN